MSTWTRDPDEVFDFGPGPLPRSALPFRLVGCPKCGELHYNNEPCPLVLVPITRDEAHAFIRKLHRHLSKPPPGDKFRIGVRAGERLVGVILVGRPCRELDNGTIACATRVCTDSTMHVASMLYGAAWRCAKAMGYRTLITYLLPEEAGTSLHAAGWVRDAVTKGGDWGRKQRPRDTVDARPKVRWRIGQCVACRDEERCICS